MKLYFQPCPKTGKRPKAAPKPIQRTPIKKRKGSAKCSDNGKRTPRRDPAKTWAWALQKQREKLEELSPAQLAIGIMLRNYGVKFEYEKPWPNGDNPYFSDLWLPDHKITIECDGNHHRDQKKADTGKSMYIARNFGVATVRVWNADVQSGIALQRIREMLGLANAVD